ncbi:MAG: PAS domain S-box protein [Gammaproteobacteria bacterium]|nr:PAS domain S-box protein [Gammaproteobacteria bacterium]MCP5196515.1 PAS domain S-box protein [Gammaproteobacteria bacterium]
MSEYRYAQQVLEQAQAEWEQRVAALTADNRALRENEERLRLVIDATSDGVWDWNLRTNEVFFSDHWYTMLGYAPDEFVASYANWRDRMHPDDLASAEAGIQAHFENRITEYNVEFRMRAKTGEWKWIHGRGKLIERDAAGRPWRMVGTHVDITERKQALLALEASEARLQSVLRVAPTGIGVVYNRVIGEVNNTLCQMIGYTREELIGQSARLLYLSDSDYAWVGKEKYQQILERGTGTVETRWRRKDGAVIQVLLSSTPLNLEDLAQGVTFTALDITERKRAAQALQLTQFAVDYASVAVCWTKADARYLYVNHEMCRSLGYSREELLTMSVLDVNAELLTLEQWQAHWRELKEAGALVFESKRRTKNGRVFPVELSTNYFEYGDEDYSIAFIRDITERKCAEEALFEAKERAQVTLHSIGDAVITTDAHAIVDYLNPVAEAFTGWTTVEAQGRSLSEVFHVVDEQDRRPVPDPVARCLQEGKITGLAHHSMLIGRHGQEYHIDDSAAPIRGWEHQLLGAVLVFRDVSETRRLTRQLEYDATHDALTGLINRPEFERRLERALASAHQYGARHALCYLDLDQFKIVNDTAGHAAGDDLLRKINKLISGIFRDRDTLARIGGDEFGLLLDNCPLDRAQLIAQNIVSGIRHYRFHWEGRVYQIGVSIGLVPITAETQDTAQLLTQADVACYIAKEMGRNRVHIYQREDAETMQRHGEILGAAGLRDALEQGRFRLHYQPIVSLSGPDLRPARYEALLRVVHKSHADEDTELVLPAAFIPAAERYGLMDAIDRWVIQAAFREYAAGIVETGAKIAINLSGNSLSDRTLLDFIKAQFAKYAFSPVQVCFEITETAAIQNLQQATELMTALKCYGSQFALDDFGSGLSSFHYLKTLPVDYLKIDGSFIKDIVGSARDRALVAAINQMSHALGIQTIAEYAEDQLIVGHLRELGVDYAQGFFFGHAAPWV